MPVERTLQRRPTSQLAAVGIGVSWQVTLRFERLATVGTAGFGEAGEVVAAARADALGGDSVEAPANEYTECCPQQSAEPKNQQNSPEARCRAARIQGNPARGRRGTAGCTHSRVTNVHAKSMIYEAQKKATHD